MNEDGIKAILQSRYDIRWFMPTEKSIFCYKGGFCAQEPFKDKDEIEAIVDLLMGRYLERQPLFLGKMTIPPDLNAPTRESLLSRIGAGTIVRWKKS